MIFDQFEKFFFGYIEVRQKEGYSVFCRFSERLQSWYDSMRFRRTRFSAGIMLKSDNCKKISFEFKAFDKMPEKIVFDIMSQNAKRETLFFDETEGRVSLKFEGEDVCIYFPYGREVGIKNILIDGNIHVHNKGCILAFGDSITQGYYSSFPSDAYPAVLGRRLNRKVYNFGVGGMYFLQGILGDLQILEEPEIVTIAYGTNDWNYEKNFKKEIPEFFRTIYQKYADKMVFVLLPPARRTQNELKAGGTLEDVRRYIKQEALKYNFSVISSGNFLDTETMFVDDGVHPNSYGMGFYSKNISDEIIAVYNLKKQI